MKTLAATFLAALALDTIGAVSPFGQKRYLPSPRQYLATCVAWGMLGLVAAAGASAARFADRFSLLMLLTMTVIGPFGQRLLGWLTSVTTFFPADQGGRP